MVRFVKSAFPLIYSCQACSKLCLVLLSLSSALVTLDSAQLLPRKDLLNIFSSVFSMSVVAFFSWLSQWSKATHPLAVAHWFGVVLSALSCPTKQSATGARN